MNTDIDILYKRIKLRRQELDMSQEELARKVGYKTKSSINKIESGQNDISQSKIYEFAKALRTTPSYLMGWEDNGVVKEEPSSYYTNDKTCEMAQFLAGNPEYRVLFDAAKDLRPEDIEIATNILDRLKKGE